MFADKKEVLKETRSILTKKKRKSKKTHPFWCYFCEERFKHKTSLRKHEMIHSDERIIKVSIQTVLEFLNAAGETQWTLIL